MNKRPFLNASAAAVYIILIVSVMNGLSSLAIPKNSILAPIVLLSLFVLSVAIMGFLFAYEPLRLYCENHKQEALLFFAKTVGVFTCFVMLFIIALLTLSLIAK